MEGILYAHLDLDRIALLVLGKNLNIATEQQKQRFKKEFKTLLVRAYSTTFTEYSDWTIHFLPLRMQPGDSKALVRTEVLQPGTQPKPIDYRMVFIQGDWKVYDIVISGISLLQNHRTTFANEVAEGGMEQLIDDLARRNAGALKQATANQ